MGVSTNKVESGGLLSTRWLMERTLLNEGIMVVTGDPGLGKTSNVRDGVNRTWSKLNPGTRWCELQFPHRPTPLRLAKALADAVSPHPMSLKNERQYTDYLEQALVRPTVLFIDEAHMLTARGMYQCRTLWDLSHTHLTIIFAGLPDTLEQIRKDKALSRRVHANIELDRITNAQSLDLMPGFHPLLETTAEDVIYRINDELAFGSFGEWSAVMKWAEDLCERSGAGELSDGMVDQIESILIRDGAPPGWEKFNRG